MRRGDTGAIRFFALLAAYVVVHLLVRLLISPTLTIDDARETVLGQTLAWGYQHRQPPLYNWLVWGALRVFGIGVPALAVVKYAVLFVAYSCLYASARRILRDPRLPAFAAFSFLLIFPISWVLHGALTHSVGVLAACALTFYALLRLEAAGSRGAYLGFGLALGVGLLSKFTYAVFAAALLGAALTVDRFRARVWHPRMLLALAVGGALAAPYAVWFATHDIALAQLYEQELRVGPGHAVAEAARGLYYVARTTVYYVGPLGLVFLAIFPATRRRLPAGAAGDPPGGRLLGRFFACVLALHVTAALTGSLAYLKFRWMMPVFALFPLYAFWRLDRVGADRRGLRRYAAVLTATEAALIAALLLVSFGGRVLPRPDPLNAPYDAIAVQIGAAGFTGGTIAAGYGALAGNLRLHFPGARVVSLEHPYYVPPRSRPPAGGDGQCLLVWEKGHATAVPEDLRAWLATALHARALGEPPVRVATAPYRFTPRHTRRVFYALLPGVGDCR